MIISRENLSIANFSLAIFITTNDNILDVDDKEDDEWLAALLGFFGIGVVIKEEESDV